MNTIKAATNKMKTGLKKKLRPRVAELFTDMAGRLRLQLRIEIGEQLVTGICCLVRPPTIGVMEILEPVASPVITMKLVIDIDFVLAMGHCFLPA
tara:strand:+ start:247 stop:531 length:285 start_codon:yes stop_codon:yes gene_type:complete